MRKQLGLTSLLLAGTLSSFGQVEATNTYTDDPIGLKEYTLKNGLKVYLSENNDQPQVYGMVVVNAGGKNDPADATGIAHYLEHMLFKGTEEMGTTDFTKEKVFLDQINDLYDKLGATEDEEERKKIQAEINDISVKAAEYSIPNELDKMLSEMGGTGVNAFTTEDYTAYHNTFPANQLERWLEIYSHRFKKPVFRLFQSELETVYEEKNRSLDDVFNKVFEEFMKNFYKNHPYGQQTILGTAEHLKNPSLKKMYEYYNKYYVPNNMALILCGDFKSDEAIALIDKKFSDWERKDVPEFPEYTEEPFKGRELIKLRATPVAVGGMGFRGPEIGHEDEIIMEVCSELLSNVNESGFLDELMINDEINAAFAFPFVYTDHGSYVIYFVPKIIGQSLGKAEELVLAKLEKLKKGEFDDEMLKAVKTGLLSTYEAQWEDNYQRASAITDCFTSGQSWSYAIDYKTKVKAVTRDDVIRVAKKYFGDNYLLVQSKMGFPKKGKLDKPAFEPVIPKEEAQSDYYKKWKEIKAADPVSRFVDFEKDIETIQLAEKVTLKKTNNPFNNLFSMQIKYGIGFYDHPNLEHLGSYLALVGTKNKSAIQIKKELFQLGSTVSYYSSKEEFIVSIEGLDENLKATLKIVNEMLTDTEVDEDKMKKVREDVKTEDKFSRRDPGYVARALLNYVLFEDKSVYLQKLSKKEMKDLTAAQVLEELKDALGYEVNISYTGQLNQQQLEAVFTGYEFNSGLKPKTDLVILDKAKFKEPKVYFVPKKKAAQSQVYFYVDGEPFDITKAERFETFNKYFGGDMSSLVFQEIREFRSLAYSTWARYVTGRKPGKENYFLAYVGCQGDKTIDAVDAMLELIKNMPQKEERMDAIRNSLIQEAASSRPGFRQIASSVNLWQIKGYTEDPNKKAIGEYRNVEFSDILNTHQQILGGKQVSIVIVGNKKRFDTKALSNYGELIKVDEKSLFSYN